MNSSEALEATVIKYKQKQNLPTFIQNAKLAYVPLKFHWLQLSNVETLF